MNDCEQKTPRISIVEMLLTHVFAGKPAIFNKLALMQNFTPDISLERKILPQAWRPIFVRLM
jgi:hypothetical protein